MAINYEALLGQAQGMYGGIMSGYQSALSQQQAAQSQVMSGYNQLQNTVLGGLAGQGRARSQEIADTYQARAGSAMQQLINSGLGNSTVQSSVGRGLQYDETKSQNQLTEQIAGMNAQYQSQLGLAGLGYQNTAAQQNAALLGQQLGYQANWQQSLLGAAMPGLNMQEQQRLQQMNAMFGTLGGGGIVRGGGGGGQRAISQRPYDGQSMQGLITARDMAPEDPWLDFGGYGGGYEMGSSPYVLPAAQSASAASLVGSVLGGGLGGGGMDFLGLMGAGASGGSGDAWSADNAMDFWG